MVRLDFICNEILTAALAHDVEFVAIEGYSYGSKYNSEVLGELGGTIRLSLWDASIPWVSIPPKTLKRYATGNGNAPKGDMVAAACEHLGYEGRSDDEADALWLQAMALDAYGEPLVELPEKQRQALKGWSTFETTLT